MPNSPTRHTSEDQLNQFNIAMRSQPWFVQWHQQRGLNPSGNGNRKLSGQEQDELEALLARNMFQGRKPEGMTIDSGGSLNQRGGWAGMPTWAKVAIAAAPVVATAGFGAAGMGPMSFLAGSSAPAAATGTGATLTSLTGAPIVAANAAPIVAGATAPTVASGGAFTTMAKFLKDPITRTVMSGAGRMISGAGDSAAANRGTQIETQLAHDQLKLVAEREARSRQAGAYRNAMLGQLATSYQPSARPTGSEGRHPQGFITPEAREAGQLLYGQGMETLKRGDAPSITPFDQLATQPGAFERFSQYAGPGLSMFDLLAEARKQR